MLYSDMAYNKSLLSETEKQDILDVWRSLSPVTQAHKLYRLYDAILNQKSFGAWYFTFDPDSPQRDTLSQTIPPEQRDANIFIDYAIKFGSLNQDHYATIEQTLLLVLDRKMVEIWQTILAADGLPHLAKQSPTEFFEYFKGTPPLYQSKAIIQDLETIISAKVATVREQLLEQAAQIMEQTNTPIGQINSLQDIVNREKIDIRSIDVVIQEATSGPELTTDLVKKSPLAGISTLLDVASLETMTTDDTHKKFILQLSLQSMPRKPLVALLENALLRDNDKQAVVIADVLVRLTPLADEFSVIYYNDDEVNAPELGNIAFADNGWTHAEEKLRANLPRILDSARQQIIVIEQSIEQSKAYLQIFDATIMPLEKESHFDFSAIRDDAEAQVVRLESLRDATIVPASLMPLLIQESNADMTISRDVRRAFFQGGGNSL